MYHTPYCNKPRQPTIHATLHYTIALHFKTNFYLTILFGVSVVYLHYSLQNCDKSWATQILEPLYETKKIIFWFTLLLALHSIPLLVYWEITNKGICFILDPIYSNYFIFSFQIILHGIIPITFLSIFGVLIYTQLKTIQKKANHE